MAQMDLSTDRNRLTDILNTLVAKAGGRRERHGLGVWAW